jgi:hypothetical protein
MALSTHSATTSARTCQMSSVYDLHLRSASLSNSHDAETPPQNVGPARQGESSGERRLRLLRTVLGDLRARPQG